MTTTLSPAPPPAHPPVAARRGRIPASWLSAAGWAIYATVAWIYLLTFPRGLALPNLDQSWSLIVTLAGAEHWAFGRQILLNYGPWAHLGNGFFYAPLFMVNYWFQIVSKAILVALICRTGRALPWPARLAFLIVNLLTGILEWETVHLLAAVYTGWLLSEDRTRAGRLIGGAGVVLVAAAGLMKTFYVVFGLGVFGCVLARHVLRGRGRRTNWLEGLWPVGGLLFCLGVDWWIAGQSFGDLPVYARGALELMDGHSRAMGIAALPAVFWMSLAAVVWTGGLAVICWSRGERCERLARLPLALLFAGDLFMAWKQGFTRPDAFHVSGYLWFVAASVTMMPLFFECGTLRRGWYYVTVAGVLILVACADQVARPTQSVHLGYELRTRPWRNLKILADPATERAELAAAAEKIRAGCDLPQTRAAVGRARIDFFGDAPDILIHNGLNYAPVPTLQGFITYTPYLVGLSERCYTPDRAPPFVLFQGGSVDGRWPSLDGAVQLRELLCNYRLRLVESGLLLLERKPAAACAPPRPILQQRGELPLDTPLAVPPDGADWCELEVHRTWLGMLINFFYHEPTLIIEAVIGDGRRARWNLPPIMARGGFLLRQGPQSRADVVSLLAGRPVAHPVASMCLRGDSLLRWAIGPEVSYRFYAMSPPKPSAN